MDRLEGEPTLASSPAAGAARLGPDAVLDHPRFPEWNRWTPPTLARHGMRTPTLLVLGLTLLGIIMLAGACVLLALAWLAPAWVPDFVPDPGAPWGSRTSILVCAGCIVMSLCGIAGLLLWGMARTSRGLAPDSVEGLRREPAEVLGTRLDSMGDPGGDGGLSRLRVELRFANGTTHEVPSQGVPRESVQVGALGVAYIHEGTLLAFQRMEVEAEAAEDTGNPRSPEDTLPRQGFGASIVAPVLLLGLTFADSGTTDLPTPAHQDPGPDSGQGAEPEVRLDPTLIHEEFIGPTERNEIRERLETDHHRIATRGLPDGWKVKEKKGFVYLNHADRKGLAHVQDYVEATWGWLEDVIPPMDPGVEVRKPVVRIFETSEEQSADGGGKPAFPHRRPEVWLNRRGLGSISVLVSQVVECHLREQDRRIRAVLPNWFNWGLEDLCKRAYLSKGKLAFVLADVDQASVQALHDRGHLIPVAILFQWGSGEAYDDWLDQHPSVKSQDATTQAKLLMTYLLTGKGTKHRDHKKIIPEVLAAYAQALAEQRESELETFDPATAPWPADEHQEQEWILGQLEKLGTQRAELQADVYFRVFRDWSEQDWKKLERAYLPDLR